MMKTENEINIKQLDKVTGGTDPELICFTSPSVLALEPDEPEEPADPDDAYITIYDSKET